MKRIISVLLIMILTLSLSFPVSADESSNIQACSVSGKKMFQYMQGDNGKLLTLRKNYGYMTFIGDFKSNALSLYLLEMTDKLIDTGAAPDKEKYMETLVNIIATYDMDRADDIAKQSNMDNLKTLKDYAMDCTEMGKNAVSVMVGTNPAASELETTLSTAVDGLSVLIDNTDNWISALSNLETIVKDYSEHDNFLKLLEEKSNGELKEAAQTLRKGMKKALEIKLDTYQDVSDKNYKNYEEFFFSDFFFDAVKQLPEYENDEALKYFIDAGDNVVSKVGTLESAWDLGKIIGTMVGDAVVGGENLINRVLEMMAIYDISEILQEKILDTGTEFLNDLGKDNEESLVETYIALSNYLIGCRIRGEYCLYSIVAEDAGLLSCFNKNSAEEAKLWYEEKTKKILSIQDDLMSIFEENVSNEEEYTIISPKEGFYQYYDGEYIYGIKFRNVQKESAEVLFGMTPDINLPYENELNQFMYSPSQHSYNVLDSRNNNEHSIVIDFLDSNNINITISGENININGQFVYVGDVLTEPEKTSVSDISEISLDEICQIVVEHYNTLEGTSDYVIYTEECIEIENGYQLMLGSIGGSAANMLVSKILVDINLEKVTDDWGNEWYLYEE